MDWEKKSAWFLLLAITFASWPGCRSETQQATPQNGNAAPRKIKLALNWFPEAEHGGFYAAKLNGHFADEGLDVEIIAGGPGAPVIPQVARGAFEFGVANADQVPLGRAQGADVVATMTAMQDSPRCILVHTDSGIESLDQLQGVTLAMSSGRAFSEYLKSKVELKDVRVVPYDGSVAPFLANQKFAIQGYEFSEPFVAQQQGAEVRVLPIRDIGFNPYTSLLITSDQLVKEDPALVAAVTRACIQGWQDYFNDRQQVNQHLVEINPEMSADAVHFGTSAIEKLSRAEGQQFGAMSVERWKTLVQQLEALQMIQPGSVSSAECFTNQFNDQEGPQ